MNCLLACLRLQPVPILDGISEHEKYGNNGDKFDVISRKLVNGYEVFSNILNTFIQVSLPTQMCRCAAVCVCKFSLDCAASLHVALHKIYHRHHHHHHRRRLQVTIKTTSQPAWLVQP